MAIQPKKDVVIVGYGASGGPASLELAKAGYSVVVLEAGPHRTTEEDFQRGSMDTLRWLTRAEMIDDKRMSLTFRTNEAEVARPWGYRMASTVGGASVHWSGQSWRYYVDDFRSKTTIQEMYGKTGRLAYLKEDRAAIEDWPLAYDEVEPYYEKVEYTIGVGGWPGNIQGKIRPINPDEGNPYEAPRQKDYPYRTLRDNATDITFRKGALERGLKPFHVPTAFTVDTWTSPEGVQRAGCTYCSFCTGFGCWNGSKGSSLSALLPAALKQKTFELRANCYVTKVNHRAGRAISVTYIDGNGVEHEQPGDIFILGAYSFQNVRLLLHSGITGNGQVGKYFINRPSVGLSAIFGDRHLNGWNGPAVQRQGIDDYNGENAAEMKLKLPESQFFIRGAFIGSPSQRVPLETYEQRPADVPRWGAGYKNYLKENLNRYMGLQLLMEGMPYEDNYIDLDPTFKDQYGIPYARVTRSVKKNDIRMGHFIWDRAKEIAEAAGATKVWGNRNAVPQPSMTHDLGGCRMGKDPTKSVVNRYCQMWTMPNVLVVGGAVHPSISGHNPTETIWMISYWAADAVIKRKINIGDAMDHT